MIAFRNPLCPPGALLWAGTQPSAAEDAQQVFEEGEEYEEVEGEETPAEGGWLSSSQRADIILRRELPHPDPSPAVGNLDLLPMLLEQIEAHILYYGRIL